MERNLIEWSRYAVKDFKRCALEVYGKPRLIKNIIHEIAERFSLKDALYFAECVIELMDED